MVRHNIRKRLLRPEVRRAGIAFIMHIFSVDDKGKRDFVQRPLFQLADAQIVPRARDDVVAEDPHVHYLLCGKCCGRVGRSADPRNSVGAGVRDVGLSFTARQEVVVRQKDKVAGLTGHIFGRRTVPSSSEFSALAFQGLFGQRSPGHEEVVNVSDDHYLEFDQRNTALRRSEIVPIHGQQGLLERRNHHSLGASAECMFIFFGLWPNSQVRQKGLSPGN